MSAIDPSLRTALQSWDFDHTVVWLLPVLLIVYVRGFRHVHARMPRRYPMWRLVSFAGGIATLFLAIASPLDALGELMLSLHMTQHMLLMMVAAPLIWLGQPVVPALRGLPVRWVKYGFEWFFRWPVTRRFGQTITHPAFCWIAFSGVLIVWHVPQLYELGLESEHWHNVQHACFFGGALLFWWPVIGVWPSDRVWPRWTMIPYLIGADLVNTALSAALSFPGRVLYPFYETVPRVTGLSPLDDQALAGVLMWVPGSIAFLLPAVLLTVRLFDARSVSDRRSSSIPASVRE
jgi:cytochrome c oxidase assembly factor CtaG